MQPSAKTNGCDQANTHKAACTLWMRSSKQTLCPIIKPPCASGRGFAHHQALNQIPTGVVPTGAAQGRWPCVKVRGHSCCALRGAANVAGRVKRPQRCKRLRCLRALKESMEIGFDVGHFFLLFGRRCDGRRITVSGACRREKIPPKLVFSALDLAPMAAPESAPPQRGRRLK